MRTPKAKAIATAAACCAVATTTGFQSAVPIRPDVRSRTLSSSLRAGHHRHPPHRADLDGDAGVVGPGAGPLGGGDEAPRSLGPGRAFLGVRRESGAMRRLLEQQQQRQPRRQAQGGGGSTTALASSVALMPDGGLSPCVIKVLGVGGGGSNAVRFSFWLHCIFEVGGRQCFVASFFDVVLCLFKCVRC